VLLIDDAISGVQPHHLEEAALLGVGHASASHTATALTGALSAAGRLTPAEHSR
jgi:hypothetical protein